MNPERLSNRNEKASFPRSTLQKAGAKAIGAVGDIQVLPPGEQHHQNRIYSPKLQMEDFSDTFSDARIRSDRDYVNYCKLRFPNQYSNDFERSAQKFERLFVSGLQIGRWLGNLPDEQGQVPFNTRSYEATPLDDISHRVDVFTTLRFTNPIETSSQIKVQQLPLAFDITLQDQRQQIVNKLTCCNNNTRLKLPFGFTQIRYYTDGHEKSSLFLVPRYVIGVSKNDIDEISQSSQPSQSRTQTTTPQPNLRSPASLTARFKVLSEIRAQNELLQAMLPDDAEESDDLSLRTAAAYIEAADEQFNHALQVCTQMITNSKMLPKDVLARIQDRPTRTRSIIEEYLLGTSHEEYVDRGRAYSRRKGRAFDDDGKDDTFVQIMRCTRQLTSALYSGEHPELEEHRTLTFHNKAFNIPEN